jgi:uncharacterized protein YkwD
MLRAARPASAKAVRRLLAATLVAALLLTGLAGAEPALAARPREQELLNLVNEARGGAGLGPLALNARLSRMARKHSRHMAADRTLYHHSCLSCRFKGRRWRVLGENVGTGGSVLKVHLMMMGSEAHRANILGGAYTRVGVGVVGRGRRVWVTEIFWG